MRAEESYQMMRLIREVHTAAMAAMNRQLSLFDITPQQAMALKIVAHAGEEGAQNQTLCTAMGLTKGTVSGIVKRLEIRGLLTRSRRERDRREERVVLTPEGERLAKEMMEAMDAGFAKLFDGESPQEVRRSLDALREISKKLERI